LKAPVTGQGCLRRSVGHPLGRMHGERGSEGKEVQEAAKKADRISGGGAAED